MNTSVFLITCLSASHTTPHAFATLASWVQTASDIFAQELILHPKSASEQIEQLGIGLRVTFGGKRRCCI